MFNIDFGSKRTKSTIRFITYGVSGVFVVGVTIALVLATLGYDIDRSTGEVIQNGLVLVDSDPDGAVVTIDGSFERDDTPGRFSLPEGVHRVEINREGYQTWSKSVSVQGAEVLWLYYPLLFPSSIASSAVTTARNMEFIEAVPGGQQMLIRVADDTSTFRLETLAKTSVTNEEMITIPPRLLDQKKGSFGTFSFAGWADGDNYFLVRHKVGSTTEFILVDVDEPSNSQNLTNTFDLPLRDVRFIDDDFRQLYALVNGDLRYLDLRDDKISSPIVKDVDRYVLHTDKFIIYLRNGDNKGTELGLIEGRDNQPKVLDTLALKPSNYRIEFAEFDNKFKLVLLDKKAGVMTILLDPQANAHNEPIMITLPGARYLSFSRNGRFAMAQYRDSFALYDFDYERRLNFKTDVAIDTKKPVKWLDGHHLTMFDASGDVYIAEFDGTNTTRIGPADRNFDVSINESQRMIYTVAEPTNNGVSIIRGIDLDSPIN